MIRSPLSDSFIGRISGMPPATAASKYRSRSAASAASNSVSPSFASSSLFAGDDRLPVRERPQDQGAGGLHAAEELADDVDRGVVDDRASVGGERLGRKRHVAVTVEVAHGDPRHLEAAAGAHRDVVGVLVEQTDHGRAHVPAAQQPHADRAFLTHLSMPPFDPVAPIVAVRRARGRSRPAPRSTRWGRLQFRPVTRRARPRGLTVVGAVLTAALIAAACTRSDRRRLRLLGRLRGLRVPGVGRRPSDRSGSRHPEPRPPDLHRAGEPIVRSLLRDVPGRRRHPDERRRLALGLPAASDARALRAPVSDHEAREPGRSRTTTRRP